MIRLIIITIFCCFGFSFVPQLQKFTASSTLYSISGQAQGTTYTIKYLDSVQRDLKYKIDSIFLKVDSSLSLYNSFSLISQFNTSTTGVKYDEHLEMVVSSSLAYSRQTNNAFDITSKPLSFLWGFQGGKSTIPPTIKQISATLSHVGPEHVFFRNDSLIKDNPHVMLDCDGIAQGYTVDLLSTYLNNIGIYNFIVELGGEVFTQGYNMNGSKWIIGIEDPSPFSNDEHFVTRKVFLSGQAITTSGSLKKFRKLGNHYYSHIMDPRTGFPVNNRIISVTVIAKNAMIADALDNAFAVMGVNAAIAQVKPKDSIGLYIIYSMSDGRLKDTSNQYFNKFFVP